MMQLENTSWIRSEVEQDSPTTIKSNETEWIEQDRGKRNYDGICFEQHAAEDNKKITVEQIGPGVSLPL